MSERRAMGPELVPLQDVLTAGIDASVAVMGPLLVEDAVGLAIARLISLGVTRIDEAQFAAACRAASGQARVDGAVASRAVACSVLGALAGQGEALRDAARRARAAI